MTAKKTAPKKKVPAQKKPVAKTAAPKASAVKLTPVQTKLVQYLVTQTEKGFGKSDDKSGLSKKGKELKAYIETHFNGYGPQVAGLMSIVTGEKIVIADRHGDSRFLKGACVVPLTCVNGHDYPLNKVAMAGANGFVHMLQDKDVLTTGNTIDNSDTAFRIATEAEIRDFVVRREENIMNFLSIVLL